MKAVAKFARLLSLGSQSVLPGQTRPNLAYLRKQIFFILVILKKNNARYETPATCCPCNNDCF
jgi:hypothetical protein